jgi:hypothetical protein
MSLRSKLSTAVDNPHIVWVRLLQKYFSTRGHDGVDIMDQDWDNLLILDACRYDLFEEVFPHEGELDSVVSRGSNTPEFLEANFVDRTFHDTVYVSANPQTERIGIEECFHAYVRLWESDWDEEARTVWPNTVTDRALEAAEQYPNKRLIVHFIQPHYPFLGETGQTIEHRTITGTGVLYDDTEHESVWKRLEVGEIDKETVWRAYRENLELAIPAIERLMKDLSGKTVITSDHGNSFGQAGIYGHPRKCYLPCLVEVPWLEIESESRREIVSESPQKRTEPDDDIAARLRDLGYRE